MDDVEKRIRTIADAVVWEGDARAIANRFMEALRSAVHLLDERQAEIERLEGFAYRIVSSVSVNAEQRIRLCEEWRHALNRGDARTPGSKDFQITQSREAAKGVSDEETC